MSGSASQRYRGSSGNGGDDEYESEASGSDPGELETQDGNNATSATSVTGSSVAGQSNDLLHAHGQYLSIFNRDASECNMTSLKEVMDKFNDPRQLEAMSVEEKKSLLKASYKLVKPFEFNKDQLKPIVDIVNNHIVSKVKFVKNEFLRLKTKEEKEKAVEFPSFWQPDLVSGGSNIALDIIERIPELKSKPIFIWAAAWMGMSRTVLEKIRYNRNNVHNLLKPVVLEGKHEFFLQCRSTKIQFGNKVSVIVNLIVS